MCNTFPAYNRLFENNVMIPVVAKIVNISGRCILLGKILGNRSFTAMTDFLFGHEVIIVGNSDRFQFSGLRVRNAKLMKVSVVPSHGILDRNVQIPERVSCRSLYPPPDCGVYNVQVYLELIQEPFLTVHSDMRRFME